MMLNAESIPFLVLDRMDKPGLKMRKLRSTTTSPGLFHDGLLHVRIHSGGIFRFLGCGFNFNCELLSPWSSCIANLPQDPPIEIWIQFPVKRAAHIPPFAAAFLFCLSLRLAVFAGRGQNILWPNGLWLCWFTISMDSNALSMQSTPHELFWIKFSESPSVNHQQLSIRARRLSSEIEKTNLQKSWSSK